MKRIALAAIVLSLVGSVANARSYHRHHHRHYQVRHYIHHQVRHYVRRWHYVRHRRRFAYSGAGLPGPCRVAASMGGPCGCWAAHVLLGRLDHVWKGINLWLADDWLRFPRAAPAPGTAAVWPHRHVAPVVAVNGDGTVTVRDSWATHRVRMAGLVFVQPPRQRRREILRWPLPVPL